MAKLMNCVGVAALRAASGAPQFAGVDGLATGLGEATDGFMGLQLAAAVSRVVGLFLLGQRAGSRTTAKGQDTLVQY